MSKSRTEPSEPIRGDAHRYMSYREAWARIKTAIDQEFFMEAATICESIISDCMDSYLALMHCPARNPETPLRARLKAFQKFLSTIHQGPISAGKHPDLLAEIEAWTKQRNAVVHGIVGPRTEDRESIEGFLSEAKATAIRGRQLARALSSWVAGEKKIVAALPRNGFRRMQVRLRELGWYVEWNHPCCQSCAWMVLGDEHPEGPYEGEKMDWSKVIFNHSQDCEYQPKPHERSPCDACKGEGWLGEEGGHCESCSGRGVILTIDMTQYDTSEAPLGESVPFICNWPEQQMESYFCINGDDSGVINFREIIPVIRSCGCRVKWDGSGDTRPLISWKDTAAP